MVYCEHPKIHFLTPQKCTLELKKITYEGSIIISGMLRIVHANFCTNPLKLIYNIDFYSKKISFFQHPKKHTKNQKLQKRAQQLLFDNNLLHSCQRTASYDDQFPLGRGGGQNIQGCPCIPVIPVYIYMNNFRNELNEVS